MELMKTIFFYCSILFLISRLFTEASAEAKTFASQYAEFGLPDPWECQLNGTDWICQMVGKGKKQQKLFILQAYPLNKKFGDCDKKDAPCFEPLLDAAEKSLFEKMKQKPKRLKQVIRQCFIFSLAYADRGEKRGTRKFFQDILDSVQEYIPRGSEGRPRKCPGD